MGRRVVKFAVVVVAAAAAVARVAVWVIPLTLAIVVIAMAPRRGSSVLHYAGPPTRPELEAYAEANRGAYPPLANPIVATYLLLGEDGLSYFRQSASVGRRQYVFVAAEPGRFDMNFYLRSGLSTYWNEEPAILRSDGEETFGLVWRNPTVTQHGWTFTCRQITLPHWFLLAAGLSPALLLTARRAVRLLRLHNRHGRQLCGDCGYDLRATPDRCPECGTVAPATGMMNARAGASLPHRVHQRLQRFLADAQQTVLRLVQVEHHVERERDHHHEADV